MKSTTVAQADNQICHQLGSWTNLLVETLVSRMEENDALFIEK